MRFIRYLLKPFQWGDYSDKVKRNKLNLGICIPDSCSAFDLQTSLQNELDRVFRPEDIEAVVKVDPIMCTVRGDMYPYNTAYYVTRSFNIIINLVLLLMSDDWHWNSWIPSKHFFLEIF